MSNKNTLFSITIIPKKGQPQLDINTIKEA